MRNLFLLLVLISGYAFSQSINDYQYVMVPSKFNIFKENDKFRLNSNVKLLLQKYGFKAYLLTDSIPYEIANAGCNKLYADLVKDNGLLDVRVKIVLKDCKDKVVYETAFGKSKEKELFVAYNQALREAGKSFETLHYKYNEKSEVEVNDATTSYQETTTEMISQKLKVVKTDGGIELYDTSNALILTARNTSVANVFIAKAGNENGILQRGKDLNWYFDYYRIGSNKLISEILYFNF